MKIFKFILAMALLVYILWNTCSTETEISNYKTLAELPPKLLLQYIWNLAGFVYFYLVFREPVEVKVVETSKEETETK